MTKLLLRKFLFVSNFNARKLWEMTMRNISRVFLNSLLVTHGLEEGGNCIIKIMTMEIIMQSSDGHNLFSS